MQNRVIVLADNSTHPINMAGESDGTVWIEVTDLKTIREAVDIFDDPAKTRRMIVRFEDTGYEYGEMINYTELIQVQKDSDCISIVLKKQEEAQNG